MDFFFLEWQLRAGGAALQLVYGHCSEAAGLELSSSREKQCFPDDSKGCVLHPSGLPSPASAMKDWWSRELQLPCKDPRDPGGINLWANH